MLTDKQKFTLMRMYMRPVLVLSGMGSVSAFAFAAIVDIEALLSAAMIVTFLKLLVLAFSIMLFLLMRNGSSKFFYINLGLSEKKLMGWAVAFDLTVYSVVMVSILILRYAIS